jgi:hypothetical protein
MFDRVITETRRFDLPTDRACSMTELQAWIEEQTRELQSTRLAFRSTVAGGTFVELTGLRLMTPAEQETAEIAKRGRAIASEHRLGEIRQGLLAE